MIKTFTFRTYFICFAFLSVITIFLKQKPSLNDNLDLSLTSRRLSEESQLVWKNLNAEERKDFWKKKKKAPKPKFEYQEIIYTTIDVKPVEGSRNKCHFSSNTMADFEDTTAVFLRNIIETDEMDGGYPVFEAEIVSFEQVKEAFQGKHILFAIHGYWNNVIDILKDMKTAKWEFSHYHPIPVLWPTYDVSAGKFSLKVKQSYLHDKKVSQAVGKTLAHHIGELVVGGHWPEDAKISLMAHSMGNRVLRYFAEDVRTKQIPIKFGSIFMVAADVEEGIFEKQDGVNIVNMLEDGGKVYVVHRKDDDRLQMSARYLNGSLRNPKNRLGQFGADMSKLHANTEGKVKNINVLGYPAASDDEGTHHNYQLVNYMIWLYESESE